MLNNNLKHNFLEKTFGTCVTIFIYTYRIQYCYIELYKQKVDTYVKLLSSHIFVFGYFFFVSSSDIG